MHIATSIITGIHYPKLIIPSSIIVEVDVEPKFHDDGKETEKNLAGTKENIIDPAIVSFQRTEKGQGLPDERGADFHYEHSLTSESREPTTKVARPSTPPQDDQPSNQVSLAFRPPQVPAGKPPPKASARGPNARRESQSVQPKANDLPQQNRLPSISNQKSQSLTDATPSATLTAPFSEPSLSVNSDGGRSNPAARGQMPNPPTYNVQPVPARDAFLAPKKASKRGKRSAKAQADDDAKGAKARITRTNPDGRPTSWQQQVSMKAQRKAGKSRSRNRDNGDQNGWATGDATDIQDMGDFDFEQNLNKFDKRKVFDEIRQGDTTADEDRLHTFNRQTRPGTGGGKNLHHTENVLDSPQQATTAEQSSADDEANVSENRRRMNRNVATRKTPSRQGSGKVAIEGHMTTSGSLSAIRESHAMSKVSSISLSHPAPSVTYSLSRRTSTQIPRSYLKIAGSNWSCPCVSPLQMLELEQLAIAEHDLTEDIMTENAGRSIAETALDIVKATSNGAVAHGQLIVILASNTKTGSRAVAAARHLRNHGARVVLVILGLDIRENLLENTRRQLKMYSNCGGKVFRPDQLKGRIKSANAPVDLILDAMLGMHLLYVDLITHDQASYLDLVTWAYNQASAILSLDVPSGIDASTGRLNLFPLFLFTSQQTSKLLLCLHLHRSCVL